MAVAELKESILLKIFAFLMPAELTRTAGTCAQWRALCFSDDLWNGLCTRWFRTPVSSGFVGRTSSHGQPGHQAANRFTLLYLASTLPRGRWTLAKATSALMCTAFTVPVCCPLVSRSESSREHFCRSPRRQGPCPVVRCWLAVFHYDSTRLPTCFLRRIPVTGWWCARQGSGAGVVWTAAPDTHTCGHGPGGCDSCSAKHSLLSSPSLQMLHGRLRPASSGSAEGDGGSFGGVGCLSPAAAASHRTHSGTPQLPSSLPSCRALHLKVVLQHAALSGSLSGGLQSRTQEPFLVLAGDMMVELKDGQLLPAYCSAGPVEPLAALDGTGPEAWGLGDGSGAAESLVAVSGSCGGEAGRALAAASRMASGALLVPGSSAVFKIAVPFVPVGGGLLAAGAHGARGCGRDELLPVFEPEALERIAGLWVPIRAVAHDGPGTGPPVTAIAHFPVDVTHSCDSDTCWLRRSCVAAACEAPDATSHLCGVGHVFGNSSSQLAHHLLPRSLPGLRPHPARHGHVDGAGAGAGTGDSTSCDATPVTDAMSPLTAATKLSRSGIAFGAGDFESRVWEMYTALPGGAFARRELEDGVAGER
jgi:hypothetical protein